MGIPGDPEVKYHPLELPANQFAAQAFYAAHPELVSLGVSMSQERQDSATAAIQDVQDRYNTLAGTIGDPRVTSPTPPPDQPTVTAVTPNTGPPSKVTAVIITGARLTNA